MLARGERYPLVFRRRRRSSVFSFARSEDLLIIAAGEFRVLCQDCYNLGEGARASVLLPVLVVHGRCGSGSDRIDYPASSFVRSFIFNALEMKEIGFLRLLQLRFDTVEMQGLS